MANLGSLLQKPAPIRGIGAPPQKPIAGLNTAVGALNNKASPANPAGDANRSILKGLGLDLDTVLTPKGRRKKKAGLVGGDVEELAALLGE